jgi:hypothetical protein
MVKSSRTWLACMGQTRNACKIPTEGASFLHVTYFHFLFSVSHVKFVLKTYSPCHMQTSVKKLKKFIFWILNYFSHHWCTTCFDRYGHPSGALRIFVENCSNSVNDYSFKVYPLSYAHICCCTSVTCNGNCVSVSRPEYKGILYPPTYIMSSH